MIQVSDVGVVDSFCLALTKYQVQKEIGKTYAGLLLLTKALYQENLITKEVYEKFVYRYSRKLVPEEQPQKLTTEQQKEKQNWTKKPDHFQQLLANGMILILARTGDSGGLMKLKNTKT